MTAREIADGLNKNKWYVKCDKSQIRTSQIIARVDDHNELFEIDRSVSPLQVKLFSRKFPSQIIKATQVSTNDTSQLEKMLMNEKNFKSADSIDNISR